ncbi:LysR family transcriptional regulator [Mycobacterium sp. NPDC006124]|uniref:LysR family transcriptional regulator n=1 Tax=Mycobacterium sp. NPDC006124 TaxID=3156729 RepID=UPI0033B3FC38
MLDVRKLVLLREVQLRGSITAAAQALSYSHSAVSQQLSALEAQAGVPLLEKVGRGVRLTNAGEELARHAEDIVAILERAESDLASSDTNVRGVLRLAAFTTVSRLLVPRLISRLHELHPQLDVRYRQVEPEPGLRLLSSRRTDVLLVDTYPGTSRTTPPDLHAETLLEDPIRVYPPANSSASRLEQLKRARWVLEPSGTEANAWTRNICRQNGFEPDVAFESPDLLFHLRMVQAGVAAAFLPDLLVRGAGVDVASAALADFHHLRGISFVCRSGAERRPSVTACRAAFAQLLADGRG